MNKRILFFAAAFALIAAFPTLPHAQAPATGTDEARRLHDASTVFNEVMAAEDSTIPNAILGKAEAIAIFPSTVKAGFVFGGIRGRGVISVRRGETWSSPAFMTLTGGSFGLQIGGQAVDIVLVINDRRGLENFVRNQFKFGAGVAVAAGPVGREAQAATDLQLRAQILSYSRARGLFAGMTIDGSTVRGDGDANARFYGMPLTTTQIVLDGMGDQRPPVPEWLETLTRYARP